jgi:site-specific recombinase XerD
LITTDFADYVSVFFKMYLPGQRGCSVNTIASYRDTFKLIVEYTEDILKKNSERMKLSDFNNDFVEGFLRWLETDRKNSRSTRNQRLAGIRSFVHYVKRKEPAFLFESKQILEIPRKRKPTKLISFLTPDSMQKMLAQPNCDDKFGFRDAVLLTLMYDSGARVQEICDLCVGDVRLEPPYTATLRGKGEKVRCVPLMAGTGELLRRYVELYNLGASYKNSYPLFTNHQHTALTRAGVAYILKKYWKLARKDDPSIPEKISPHVLRHTKAMHMLQADMNIVYIRDFLGHSHVETTEVYAKADTEMKRAAIEKAQVVSAPELPDWKNDKPLMSMLKNLC